MNPIRIYGVLAALVTPMTAAEEIDFGKLAQFADHLIRQGIHGLIPLGSTGEYYALSPQERHDVLKATLEAAAGRVPVLAGTNAGSTRDVIQYSRQAEKLGAAGVLLAPPYYSLPRLDELFAHFRAVSNAIGIPIMLYNYPGRTGVDMPPDFIERLASLSRVKYVKESTGEIARISTLIRRCGDRLGVFCGADTAAFESFVLGATGWVGGVANVLPKSHAQLYELAVVRKDYAAARALYFKMLPTLGLMEGEGKYTQYVKAACGLAGHPVGPPRRPLRPATAKETARLQAALNLLEENQVGRQPFD
jgi:4-hydroxy-tetrahydrodipicolinate synthase